MDRVLAPVTPLQILAALLTCFLCLVVFLQGVAGPAELLVVSLVMFSHLFFLAYFGSAFYLFLDWLDYDQEVLINGSPSEGSNLGLATPSKVAIFGVLILSAINNPLSWPFEMLAFVIGALLITYMINAGVRYRRKKKVDPIPAHLSRFQRHERPACCVAFC